MIRLHSGHVKSMRWIATSEPDLGSERVTAAIATANRQALEVERIQREGRDLATSFRLEQAITRFPAHALL